MSQRRILVVDDEPKMRRILELMLKEMGHEVVLAANGRDALKLARGTRLDLVMTDLRMPGSLPRPITPFSPIPSRRSAVGGTI